MADAPDGPPVVDLPERIDRRLRLGPFSSSRDALKFVSYAAVGAVLAPFTSPYLWLAVVGAGFVLSVYRTDGRALDEEAAAFVLWKLRAATGGGSMTGRPGKPLVRQGVIGAGPGQYAAIVQTGGTPIAYLPPGELARRFDLFRDLLRSLRSGLAFSVSATPMDPRPVVPPTLEPGRRDEPARAGYSELVTLLCRRRSVRRIDLVLVSSALGAAGVSDLESRVRTLTDHLEALGVRTVRLRHRALRDAARRWGWGWGA
ncbi:MAG: hypothetical protein ACREDE_09015 [Thermoplasmata archaeon]